MNRSHHPNWNRRAPALSWLATGLLALSGCASAPAVAPAPSPPPMFHGHPWPLDAQGHPLEGTTVVMGLVDVTGRMTEVCINRSSGHRELDRLAVRWLVARHFNPGRDHGKPVAGYIRAPVEFALQPTAAEALPASFCRTRPIADVLKNLD